MSKLHTDSTSAAQHKTQGKRKANRWKIDCERRREEHKTLLRFPSPKSLNYYYWLLFYYFNNVHSYGPIRNKSHVLHIIQIPVFCCNAVRSSLARSYMPDVLLPVNPRMRECTWHIRLYLVLYYNDTRTVTVQLPMRVLHGVYHSSPTVVRISHLMWLTTARLWCSPD